MKRWVGGRAGAFVGMVALAIGFVFSMPTRPADAGQACSFVVDPEGAQVRGLDITVTGSFTSHPNSQFSVYLTKNLDPFASGDWIALEPPGTTSITSAFAHTVTIPFEVPADDYFLVVAAPLKTCHDVYTVLPFLILQPPGGIVLPTTTTTTMPEAAPTTTTVPETTTTTEAPEETTTTTEAVEETTTTVEDEDDDEVLVAAEAVEGGAPGWMIGLLIAMGMALVGLVAFMVGQRSRARPVGPDEPPPPAPES